MPVLERTPATFLNVAARGVTRRDVLCSAAAAGAVHLARAVPLSQRTVITPLGLPGLFPGRVAAVEHRGSITAGLYQPPILPQMFQTGMKELTGAPGWQEAWRLFFEPGDVVGIKVNPVGQPYIISSPVVLQEIVKGLETAGVDRKDIVVYDRYRNEFLSAGMDTWVPQGVRTMWASEEWTEIQQSIDGYDPDHYMEMPFGVPGQDPGLPQARRSHAALFITKHVNKLVNLTVLKDHQAAGVTLALKNLGYGLVNNVNRSHPDATHNYTGLFIPVAVSIPAIRNKAVLHILDGIQGLYHSGPHSQPQFLWNHHTLYFATDAVALDRIGWDVIDRKRVSEGMLPVALAPPDQYSIFTNRHPEHILNAGMLGLGEWDLARIHYRHVRLDTPQTSRPVRSGEPIPVPGVGASR